MLPDLTAVHFCLCCYIAAFLGTRSALVRPPFLTAVWSFLARSSDQCRWLGTRSGVEAGGAHQTACLSPNGTASPPQIEVRVRVRPCQSPAGFWWARTWGRRGKQLREDRGKKMRFKNSPVQCLLMMLICPHCNSPAFFCLLTLKRSPSNFSPST